MAKLKKDGTEKKIVRNKVKGKSSRVQPVTYEEARKIMRYFEEEKKWIHYLMFGLQLCVGRRFSDMVKLRWCDLFDTTTGELRQFLNEICEKKTKKFTDNFLTIGNFANAVILNYLNHVAYCNPSADNYSGYVFLQYSGPYEGCILSISAHGRVLKKTGIAVGIPYNLGTHTARKTFAAMMFEANAGDPTVLYNIQATLGHSSPETTIVYIQNTQKATATYTNQLDSNLTKYVLNGEDYVGENKSEIIRCRRGDLIDLLCEAVDTVALTNGDLNSVKIQYIKKISEIVLS